MCVSLCECGYAHVSMGAHTPEEGFGVTGLCEALDVALGNQLRTSERAANALHRKAISANL